MKITSKQLLLLLEVLKESMTNLSVPVLTKDQKRKLYQEIMDQQSNKIVEIHDE